ncbi:MAG: lipoprotein [Hoeflea sp.]|uniref:LPS translocon maturation chaperone LptM n=1 Tax=Hoeflea sp. TaxID=1940281 RepID=UPI001DD6BEB6|nr:lipoprotein [Hoeflea sp.]MBU4528653.1 lipoprotein [Alphaproteobacteria bacterium]MBU4545542.1 lipoprotein [Alphaproteobacteria bacterium]MBU4552152.1 lipoprotein [Alphaproteobacteria bacterium]MBV1726256.1 lipoprotein [Hoeflea sp.]MBV1762317.1 lipoprotein [Hoeflea sp.]
MTTGPWIKILCAMTLSVAVLSGCGRKGPLERPGVSVVPAAATEEATDPAPVNDRRFVLDGLLE